MSKQINKTAMQEIFKNYPQLPLFAIYLIVGLVAIAAGLLFEDKPKD